MDAILIVLLVGFLDPVRWIIAALSAWIVPHRWGAVALAVAAGLVLAAVLTPHARTEAVIAGTLATGVIAFGLATWRQRRRAKKKSALAVPPTSHPEDAARLAPHKAESHHELLAALKLIAPAKGIVLDAFMPLRKSGLFDLDFDDVAGEVISHLVAFHSTLVMEQPQPMPLAAFALGRAVAVCFDAPHEYEQQRACAIALGEVLKRAMLREWPAADQALLASATEAFFAWGRRPNRMNLGPMFQ